MTKRTKRLSILLGAMLGCFLVALIMLYAASSAINPPDGQFGQIHAHLTDGIAIKIDGSLKHGTGQGMTNAIKDCLKNWGWRL